MKHTSFRLTALAALCLPAAVFTTQVLANDDAEQADGPATRFIIKYKESAADISAALPQSVGQQMKAQRMAEKAQRFSSRAGENMRFVRGMGLNKHAVFRAERKLSKRETQRNCWHRMMK